MTWKFGGYNDVVQKIHHKDGIVVELGPSLLDILIEWSIPSIPPKIPY